MSDWGPRGGGDSQWSGASMEFGASRGGGGGGHNEESITIEVPDNAMSRIIGKGGSKIREIEETSGARVKVQKDGHGPTRQIDIVGSTQCADIAERMITEIVERFSDRGGGGGYQDRGYDRGGRGGGYDRGGRGGGYDRGGFDRGSGGGESVTIEVPSGCIKRVIGKGGSKIREIEGTSGARVKIDKDSQNQYTTQIVLIGGSNERHIAENMIQELASLEDRFAGGGGGGGGRGGDRGYSGGDDDWSDDDDNPVVQPLTTATHDQNGITQYNNSNNNLSDTDEDDWSVPSKWESNGSFGFGRGRGSVPQTNGFTSNAGPGHNKSNRNNTTRLEVGNTSVVKIIGKGGSKLRETEQECGVQIKICKEQADALNTPVLIIGPDGAREKAEKAIHDILYKPIFEDKVEQTPTVPRRIIDWSSISERMESDRIAKFKDLPPIKKDFYIESPIVSQRHPDEVEEMRKNNMNIQVVDLSKDGSHNIPNPVATFQEAFENYPDILVEIERAGFEFPTPIQMQAWPVALQGLDLIGIAQTGTGKTLAFLLPAFIHIEGQPVPRCEREGPTVLVLSPTRELALQIQSEVEKYKYRGIRCVCVYGGGNRRQQIATVGKGVEIVVATPGRLNDLIMNDILSLKSVTYLVLDEADRMLDMGFEPEIRKVLLDIRPDRQTLMTSATWPSEVQDLAERYMSNPIQVFINTLDLAAVHSVKQYVEIIDQEFKRDRLYDFIHEEMGPDDKVIIFVGKKVLADDISSDFGLKDIRCQCLHGDREQIDREQALSDLKSGIVRILIATDVASRGLDIVDVTHVFNYDFPRNIEEYVHRVGRTGRAGRKGTAITLVTRQDWGKVSELIKILEEAGQVVPVELQDMADRYKVHQSRQREGGEGRFGGGHGRGNGCFKCGQSGHFARECPNAEGSSSKFGSRGGGFGSRGAGFGSRGGGRDRRGRDKGPVVFCKFTDGIP